MDTTYFAGPHDILQDAVGLKEDMLAVTDLDLFTHDGIDEGQVGETTVEEVRQRFDDLHERGFADEHRMEDAVRRIGFGVLPNTATRVRSVTDIHGEEQIINGLLPINGQDHMLRFMLHDGCDESEDIVHVMRTDIMLERLGFLAAEGVYAKTDGVDEVTMMLNAVSPIGDAADIDRMALTAEETMEAHFMALVQSPEPSPVVSRTAGHETHLDLRPLFGRQVGPHDAVDRFGERTVAAEHQYLIVSFLHQFARQFDRMTCELRHAVRKGRMALTQQFP